MPIVPPDIVLMMLGFFTVLGALPLMLGRVRPNRIYGIRVEEAYASEQNWYAINKFGGSRFLRFGAIVAAEGLVLHQYPQAPYWVPIACMFAVLPLVLITVGAIKKYVRAL